MSQTEQTPIPFLDLKLLHRPLKAQLMEAFGAAVDGAAFVGGAQLSAFESEFAAFCGAGGSLGVGSGTDALVMGLKGLGLKPGFLALTVPNTFIATVEAVSMAGGRFAFVDVDPETALMDMNILEKELARRFAAADATQRPQVIIPVHLYGQCADMDALRALADKYELLVLEDAAQAHGATWRGRKAGTLGDAAGFSFYAGKNIGALGEAGAVVSNDPAVLERIRILREHGQNEKYMHRMADGGNHRMDAIQAAFLRIKLPHLESWNESRRAISMVYDEALAKLPGVRPVQIRPEAVSSRHIYAVHTPHRAEMAAHLAARGIATGMHYPVPLHLQECYASLGLGPGAFPVAERLSAQELSLPLFPGMTQPQIERVIEAVCGFKADK